MKTALYQGVGRIIRGVFSRGRAFLPPTARSPDMLRGEGGHNIRTIYGYWGGVYPLGYGWGAQGIGCPILGSLPQVSRGVKGAGRGGDTPPRLVHPIWHSLCHRTPVLSCQYSPPVYTYC